MRSAHLPRWAGAGAVVGRALSVFMVALFMGLWSAPAHALCLAPLCSCQVGTTAVVFPAYNPLSTTSGASAGNVRVICGGVAGLLIPYDVALSRGGGPSFGNRQMSSGARKLSYNLYRDASLGSVWGDGSGLSALLLGSVVLDSLGLAAPRNHSVYGHMPGGQFAAEPGVYTDTITVTLTYY